MAGGSNGFAAEAADGYVYRITREERVNDYRNPSFSWQLPEAERPYVWITHVKICSKRSAQAQVRFLRQCEANGQRREVPPMERLVRVERAPYHAFEDVTEDMP